MSAADIAQSVNNAFKDLGVVRPTREALANIAIPDESKMFLVEGGLPKGRVFGFDFGPVQTLPAVNVYADNRGYPQIRDDLAASRCIGDSWGLLMVLDALAWNVLWIDTRGEQEDMFVNSNIESLGASLVAYASLGPLRGTLNPTQLSAEFEKMLLHIDAPCVAGWWSAVIQAVGFQLC